jgi:hypothetical protein
LLAVDVVELLPNDVNDKKVQECAKEFGVKLDAVCQLLASALKGGTVEIMLRKLDVN